MVKLNLHLCFVFLEHTFYLSSLQNYKIIAFQKERNYFSFLWLCIQKIFIYIQADQNWAMNICYWTQWIDLWNSPATFFHGRYFRNNHPPPQSLDHLGINYLYLCLGCDDYRLHPAAIISSIDRPNPPIQSSRVRDLNSWIELIQD